MGISCRMRKYGPGKAQWVRSLVHKPGVLSSIPRTHIEVEGESWLPRVVPWPPHVHSGMHTLTHIMHACTHPPTATHMHIHTHNYIKIWTNRNLVRHARSEKWNLQRWLSDVTMSTVTSTGHIFLFIPPDWSSAEPENTAQQIQKDWNHTKFIFCPQQNLICQQQKNLENPQIFGS